MTPHNQLSDAIRKAEIRQTSGHLQTMDHLIECAERHGEPDVANVLSEQMDGYSVIATNLDQP